MVQITRGLAVVFACVGILIPRGAIGAPPFAAEAPAIVDVALRDGGMLLGQVVDGQGIPAAYQEVSLQQQGEQLASLQTDAHGRFAFSGLRGGVYRIGAGEGGGLYRAWAPQTAPPSAQPAALVVADADAVRGQFGGGLFGWLSNPWIIAGLVATAIAVPLALSDRNNGS